MIGTGRSSHRGPSHGICGITYRQIRAASDMENNASHPASVSLGKGAWDCDLNVAVPPEKEVRSSQACKHLSLLKGIDDNEVMCRLRCSRRLPQWISHLKEFRPSRHAKTWTTWCAATVPGSQCISDTCRIHSSIDTATRMRHLHVRSSAIMR